MTRALALQSISCLGLNALLAAMQLVQAPGTASAQPPGQSLERRIGPPEEQLPLPQPLPEERPAPLAPESAPLLPQRPADDGLRILVRQIRVVGSTVLSKRDIHEVTRQYEGRLLSNADLFAVRDAITRLYIERGYVTSGAIIPDQDVVDGVVTIQVIEGSLDEIRIEGLRALRRSYVEDRIRQSAGPPLRIGDLQERLQFLIDDPMIESLDARLGPSARLGAARLDMGVVEAPRFTGNARFNNDRSPAVNELGGETDLTARTVFGFSDPLRLEVEGSEGLRRIAGSYAVPVTSFDLRPFVAAEYIRSKVVEHPFEDLNIKSDAASLDVGLRVPAWQQAESPADADGQPVAAPAQHSLALELLLSRRRSETFLLGEPFSFSEGADNGRSDVTVLRFVQDWLTRTPNAAMAARSTMSFGLDALGATINSSGPDGRFFAWLGQAQWVQRLTTRDDQLILRGDVQITDRPLLPLEQYALGGLDTVRGYRTNQLVTDNGWSLSLEGRVPLFRLPVPWVSETIDDGRLVLAPFTDLGRGWNTDRSTPDNHFLYSAGCGLRWRVSENIEGFIYYAHAFVDVPEPEDNSLQDQGVFFQLAVGF
jgi:hemolysin activation/secretion protein